MEFKETPYDETLGKCKHCNANNVRSPKTGKVFCSDKCWLKRGVASNGQSAPQNPTTGQNRGYNPIAETSANVKQAQDNKQEAIRLSSSGRDAVLITTTLYPELSLDGGGDGKTKEQRIQERIEYWNKYLFEKIYCDSPFK